MRGVRRRGKKWSAVFWPKVELQLLVKCRCRDVQEDMTSRGAVLEVQRQSAWERPRGVRTAVKGLVQRNAIPKVRNNCRIEVLRKCDNIITAAFGLLRFTKVGTTTAVACFLVMVLYPKRLDESE